MQNEIAVVLVGLLHWMQPIIRDILCPNIGFKKSAATVNNEVVLNTKWQQSVLCNCGVTGGMLWSHRLSFVCSRVIVERATRIFYCLANDVRTTSLTTLVEHCVKEWAPGGGLH